MAAAVSSSVAACFSVRWLRLSDAALISRVSVRISRAFSMTLRIAVLSCVLALLKSIRSASNSGEKGISSRYERSPSASAVSADLIPSIASLRGVALVAYLTTLKGFLSGPRIGL